MRILVVEDDHDARDFLASCLEEKCFAVDTASDGTKGLYMARTNEYDLIVLDYSMPGKNGFEVSKLLRSEGIDTPIIITSVMGETLHKITGFENGIDDYVSKPFYFQELHARIKAILARPKKRESTVFQLDDLVLDVDKQSVRRGDLSIYLTRKEFSLLELLLRNSGNVVSRGMLMEHTWDVNLDPFSNTIETHILNLRKKVDCAPFTKLIHTVPGRGYKLDFSR